MRYLKNYEAHLHPYESHITPVHLLCIKNGNGNGLYKFTPYNTYEMSISIKSQWNNIWKVYDEFITHADNFKERYVHIYLLQATAHNEKFKYYYEDGGALFTTETIEEYNKRKNIEKFDL